MSPLVVLAAVSAVGVAALFAALVRFLAAIDRELEDIGGPATRFFAPVNFLSKIRMGVRAIERQTAAIVPQVTRLNGGLAGIRDGLRAVDGNLAGLIEAVSRQGSGGTRR
jgi:hypothetical protein